MTVRVMPVTLAAVRGRTDATGKAVVPLSVITDLGVRKGPAPDRRLREGLIGGAQIQAASSGW